MSYFMVLTDRFMWGVGDDLKTAKRNACYNKSRDDGFVIEWDKEPDDWNISMWGEVTWNGAEKVDSYHLRKPTGKRVENDQA